jgi:hypothetical protein
MTDMRTTIPVMVLAASILCSPSVSSIAQHCETLGCYTADCWWVGPGHRRCRRVCRRRCWHPPRHEQQPLYVRPEYSPPSHYVAPDQQGQRPPASPSSEPQANSTGFLLVLGGAGFIVLIIAAALTSERAAVDRVHEATDEARQDVAQAGALAQRAVVTADEIDRYIAQQIADAYERGRHSVSDGHHG